MIQHVLLFNRPTLADDGGARPALSITGELDGYVPGDQYEGRLQINNAVGFCSLQVLPGTQLPPDASVALDQTNKQIVISWNAPAEETTSILPGGDFEKEDQWKWGSGWRWITGYDHLSGNHSAGFADWKGNSWLENASLVPVIGGTTINATLQVQQGGSSAGNVRAGCALQWLDIDLNVLKADVGNIVTSGSDGAWHPSNVSATAPQAALFVRPLVFGSRKRENALLYVDDFTWDYTYKPGATSDDDYPIRLKVTDSLGQTAYWTGTLSQYYLYYTSPIYPLPYIREPIATSVDMLAGYLGPGLLVAPPEQFGSSVSFVSGELRPIGVTIKSPPEQFATNIAFVSGNLTVTVSYRTISAGHEEFSTSASLVSGQILPNQAKYTTYSKEVYSITTSVSLVSGSLTKG